MDAESGEMKRTGCLTLTLVLMMVFYLLLGLLYLVLFPLLGDAVEGLPGWAYPLLGLLAAVSFVSLIPVWRFRRIGVFGFAGASVLSAVILLMVSSVGAAVFPLVMLLLLGVVIRPYWMEMS